MKKVYMVCDYTDKTASSLHGALNIGVEFMGNCGGRIVHEDGQEIGRHHSSSFGWLRIDLRGKLDNPVPERFQKELTVTQEAK